MYCLASLLEWQQHQGMYAPMGTQLSGSFGNTLGQSMQPQQPLSPQKTQVETLYQRSADLGAPRPAGAAHPPVQGLGRLCRECVPAGFLCLAPMHQLLHNSGMKWCWRRR